MKFCPKCKTEKPETEFHKDRHRKGGLQVYCKACCKAIASAFRAKLSPEQRLERQREHCKKHPDECKRYQRRHKLKRKYGLTEADFEAMLLLQNNKCAICVRELTDEPRTARHVDHCHTTGKVRGILCQHCNVGLGRFQDSEAALLSAVEYLRKNKQ